MFYSNQILARKGPLGLVWIAAHLDRQLKRQQINNTSIPVSVDTLLDSEVPLALRLSGQLLLGVVRIYARKVNYLQQDCNDALVKIRVALRPADGVNLPPGSLTAPVEAITLLGPKHAAAAKASRAAGRKAGGAAAAAAGDKGADAFELDVDDIYWEQDVLLGGDGAGGFNMFELHGGTFELGLAAPSGSGPMSQDVSGVFGMHSSQDYQEEFFDAEDEEAAAAWDLDELEVERLRAVASSQQQQLSSGVSGLLGLGGATPGVEGPAGKATPAGSEYDDEQMQPPPTDLPDEPPASPDVTGGARAAAAATAGFAAGQTPMSTWAGTAGGFAVDGDVLPPTPRSTAGGSQGGEGAAGYTGGTAAGYTPGSTGGRGADVQGLLPPTPSMSLGGGTTPGAVAGADEEHGEIEEQQQQGQDAYMIDVEEATAAEDEQQQGRQVKTFQRRTRQQQEDKAAGQAAAAAGAGGSSAAQEPDAAEPAAEAPKAKAAAEKQKRGAAAALLGQKRRMVIDSYPEEPTDGAAAAGSGSAGKRAGRAAAGRRQPPTELPASEIRALLADRTPLLDQTRLQSQGKRLRLEAALVRAGLSGSMSLAFKGAAAPGAATAAGSAAAAAAGGLQLQLAVTRTAAGTADRGSGRMSSHAALAALLGGASSTGAGAGCSGNSSGVGSLAAGGLLGYGGSLTDGLGVVGGLGLRLPPGLQQMFLQAAAAGAAAAPGGGPGAVAPVAAPDEIGMVGEDELEFGGPGAAAAGVAGAIPAGMGGRLSGATRSSLSLSLSTPGSTAAASAAAGAEQTPATVAGQQAGLPGSAGGTAGLGSAGFGSAGFDGYTPGSLCGAAGGEAGATADGVLQPLSAAGVAAASQQQGLVLTGGMLEDDGVHHEVELFHEEFHGEDGREYQHEDSDKENPPPPASAGKGAAALAAAAAVHGGAAGVFGSSLASTQEGIMPWPADAETLQEQEEDDGRLPADGGFTSRTRLVMRHLQHAATAAAASMSAAAAGMPATGSKRRISAVPPPGLGAAVGDKQTGGQAGAGGVAASSLSFQGLTQGHGRLDACRWFYEMLVLGNKGLVRLQQQEAYGDVLITPNLAAMARI